MYVPFAFVRCPSCGATFESGASIAPHANGNATTCPPADQVAPASITAPVLHTWKDIAAYLSVGVRTAERWEHDWGLPVHRPNQQERSLILAFREEINEWLHRTPVGLQPKRADSGGRRKAVHAPASEDQCA